MTTPTRRQPRGAARRDAIVTAAAALVLDVGPAALTHRTIAQRADVPLAATTYYFASLDDLVGAAGTLLAERWATHADGVVESLAAEVLPAGGPGGAVSDDPAVEGRAGGPSALTAERRCAVLVDAVLPAGDDRAVRGHYEHLVSAGRDEVLAAAYAAGRAGLDDAVTRLVDLLGVPAGPEVVVAVVDGAAVSALSEGRDVRVHAELLLRRLLLALEPGGEPVPRILRGGSADSAVSTHSALDEAHGA
ncbi:uncharacterized conserved protein [Sanguibacter keddieii DSM 10542]|uniref:Uncharacterized conserved protein n=1 Tax=Sanguibacter keddieii (strain ATCC 51767 / DSM 10542 / NCFB 3025 / ST-74) TaxID=446469 RepID=D1BBC1_SANKS|nr:TetR family transcriptional regulator [Sanguibacter keddieii]ACZ20687.1 uncharacterized conserved protein [Sanguibacter keddieii DSM 10542]